jgi:hypothetical protein
MPEHGKTAMMKFIESQRKAPSEKAITIEALLSSRFNAAINTINIEHNNAKYIWHIIQTPYLSSDFYPVLIHTISEQKHLTSAALFHPSSQQMFPCFFPVPIINDSAISFWRAMYGTPRTITSTIKLDIANILLKSAIKKANFTKRLSEIYKHTLNFINYTTNNGPGFHTTDFLDDLGLPSRTIQYIKGKNPISWMDYFVAGKKACALQGGLRTVKKKERRFQKRFTKAIKNQILLREDRKAWYKYNHSQPIILDIKE